MIKIQRLSRLCRQLFTFLLLIGVAISFTQNPERQLSDVVVVSASDSPLSFDWRDHTTITPVKNQADCNSYYAFSTAAYFQQDLILYQGANTSIDLSEQYLTTCLPNGGCNGGSIVDATTLVLTQGGMPTQSAYPFSPWTNQPADICYPPNIVNVGTRPMYSFYNLEDQQFLKTLILKQPLNIDICSPDLKTYGPTSNTNRTLSCNAANTYPDFSVLLIGYTQTEWIIKNSWGSSWGLGGFGYISRNPSSDCCIGYQVLLRGNQTDNSTCTVKNCEVCVETNFCSTCNPGYYVSNINGTQTCLECTYSNCAQCRNDLGYCETCIYGYALYYPNQVCNISAIPNCKSIVNGGCHQCHDGYTVTANFTCNFDCKISNCSTCKDDKSCSECQPGFQLAYAGGILACQQFKCKIPNCATCDSIGKCLTCVGSYLLFEGSCIMNCTFQNCVECSTTLNICQNCQAGYARDFYSNLCVTTSVSNCNVTYLTKYCSICNQGYTRSDSWQTCNKNCNIDNCQSCQANLTNQCNACNPGYTLTTPSGQTIAVCQQNPCNFTNCSLCDASGTTCIQCIDNYHIWSFPQKSCIPYVCNISNCQKCQTNQTVCQQCNVNTILYIPQGNCMTSNIANCEQLGVSQNGIECWGCITGFEIDYTTWKDCLRICTDSNCLNCSASASMCTLCPSGYLLQNVSATSSNCLKIPTYLPNCLLGNQNQTICYQCAEYYYFNTTSGACQLNSNCSANCIMCTSDPNAAVKCVCKSGLVWQFQQNQCVLNPSDANCLVISNYTGTIQCFQCAQGYTLSANGKGCSSDCVVEFCSLCVHSSIQFYPDFCQTCSDGYVATLNLTKCVPCLVDFCKTCLSYSQRSTCTQCKVGYTLLANGSCQEIPCQQNALFNGLACACLTSFYLDNSTNTCLNCNSNCDNCLSASTCLQCSYGYFLTSNKQCSPCLENCKTCSDGNTCNACQEGYTYQINNGQNSCQQIGLGKEGYYVLSNGEKARCEPGCASCAQSNLVCQQCLQGYILESQNCIKCSSNCKTCYPNILSACKSCEIGYLLMGDKCVGCNSTLCLQCPVQTDICIKCIAGYYIKDQSCISCGLGCSDCNLNGTCTACKSGFTMLANGYCQQCIDGCSQCNSSSLATCQGGCLSGTYQDVKSSICLPCPSACATCSSVTFCTSCNEDFTLFKGVCQTSCSDQNCFNCSGNTSVCIECYAGYKITNGLCTSDLSCNVQTTNSNTNANSSIKSNNSNVQTNTTTNTNGTKASTNTTSVTSVTLCQACPRKYYLSPKFTCLQCQNTDLNCIQCDENNPTNCTNCADTYFLNENLTCQQCSPSCTTCRSQTLCYICANGYFMIEEPKLYSGNCIQCDPNCLTCVGTPTNCLTCKTGHTLSVAKFCMNNDLIKFIIRLDMPFSYYNKQAPKIRSGINSYFYNTEYSYLTQYYNVTEGSTIMNGYVAVPQPEAKAGLTYSNLINNMAVGSNLDGYKILSVSMSYNGSNYNSALPPPDNGGVKGWVIAVAVVGGIIGLIVLLIIIGVLYKKIKKSSDKSDDDENALSASGKNTQSALKKENPQLGISQ